MLPLRAVDESFSPEVSGSETGGVFSPHPIRASPPSMQDWSEFLLEQLPLIERVIRTVCRGRRMDGPEIEEFAAVVRLRLVENNYAIIRKFKGRSSFGTYITTVVSRLLKDQRDRDWGKWRSSAEAKRLGPMAMDLERLLMRDQRTIDEAYVELAPQYPDITKPMLEQYASRFPVRHRRKLISLDECSDAITIPGEGEVETAQTASVISSIVSRFIESLSKEDQLIFQLRFEGDMPVPQIARSLRQDTQLLYRRLRKHFEDLRIALEKAGIDARDVAKLAGSDGALLDFRLKSIDRRPSNGDENGDPEVAPEEGP